MSYARYKETQDVNQVNELIKNGWVVIKQGKAMDAYVGEYVFFLMGYPFSEKEKQLEQMIADLRMIIYEYDLREYTEAVFADMAADEGYELDEIVEALKWFGEHKSKAAEFIMKFENLIYGNDEKAKAEYGFLNNYKKED